MSVGRRRFLKTLAAGAAATVATPVYAHEIEAEHLEVVTRDVFLPNWPAHADGLRVGHLGDFHCHDDRAVARAARAAHLLLEQKPDVVFLTGDYITGRVDGGGDFRPQAEACADALASLKAVPHGVFAVMGNHDLTRAATAFELCRTALERVGFHVLINQSAPLPGADGVWLVGLGSCSVKAQHMEGALAGVPAEAVRLLLVHEPDYADECPPGFALQFSGHSHGGQIRVPGLPPVYCPNYGRKYPEGLENTLMHPVYTTRGVGMMGPQMRLCCPPEVTLLTLRHL